MFLAGAFWGEGTRAFLGTRDGSSLDARWVDVPALRTEWERSDPDARTYPLLQAAWAASADPQGPEAGNTPPVMVDGATMPPTRSTPGDAVDLKPYETPTFDQAGSVRGLTQQFKQFGGADGVQLSIPDVGNIPLGDLMS